jgi:uncharacterized repeat protein (TIGR01451 family)
MHKLTTRAFRTAATGVAMAVMLGAATAVALAQGTGTSANLALTKSDSPDPVISGMPLTYTVELTNNGPDPATDVAITDQLSGGVEFVSAIPSAGTCDASGRKVTCDAPTLAADTTLAITIIVNVTKKSGTITNSASAQSAVPDTHPENNLATEATQVIKPPIPPGPSGPTCRGRKPTIVGTEGDDSITGTEKKDVIVALGGNDTVFALGGNDVVCGFPGDDTIRGSAGIDLIRGSSGNDVLKAGADNDHVGGGLGRDRLGGGLGSDVLNGGPGRDHCNGGPAPDVKRSC